MLGYFGAVRVMDWPRQREEAKVWAAPGKGGSPAIWDLRKCKVLGVGIASRGGCWRQAPESNFWYTPEPAYFSECPGLRWCADEGSTCYCPDGDVLFAATQHNGNLPVGDLTNVAHLGAGPVKCLAAPGSSFTKDPLPGERKSCFCTPKRLKDQLLKYSDPVEPADGACRERADRAFQLEAAAPVAARRKLAAAGDRGSAAGGLRAVGLHVGDLAASPVLDSFGGTEQKWMLPDGRCSSNSFDMYESDYPVFLPWALVEEQPTPIESGAPSGNASAAQEPRLRCAFSYGADAASREELDGAKLLYKKWSKQESETVPCYVRLGGECGDSGCAVALEDIHEFGQEDTAAREMYYLFGYIVAMIIGCPVFGALFFCCLMACPPVVTRTTHTPLNEEEDSDAGGSSPMTPITSGDA